jgi:hypothetical protein
MGKEITIDNKNKEEYIKAVLKYYSMTKTLD